MSQIILSFWGIAFFPVTSAPQYRRGFIATFPLAVVCALVCAGIRYLDVRDIKQQMREGNAIRNLNGLALQAIDSGGDAESDIGADKKNLHVVTDVLPVP
ncbi:hypothetical protein CPB85DRAFT_1432464 [Mucidula mucida]|nr:hypothetical protein CPB85DRAFT_1432464 [Mucidula mucida]